MNDLSILGAPSPVVNQDIMKGSDVVSSQPRGLADSSLTENHITENEIQHNGLESLPVKEATSLEQKENERDSVKPSYHSENVYDFKYQNTEHSSDIESDLDHEELNPGSPQAGEYQDRRTIDITQRLPSSLGQFSSPFSAEEARLRYSLESAQLKERFHHLNPAFGEEARRRFSLPESKQLDISLSSNHSSPPNSPDSNSLSKSPYTPYKGQGHGTPRSLDRSFEDQDSYALTANVREGLYFCHLCNFSGTTQKEFDQHMTVHFEHVCPHCDYKSRTEGRLKRHIKDFHTEDSDGFGTRTMPGRPKVFRCKQCEYSTTDKIEFWTHSRTHIKEDKLLQCPRCPFVTEYKHHLEYHLRNHFGSKPFKCPKCNYACVNKSMLNSHMKSHTNVYQYRCADCTYATKYCHSLKLHLRKYNHKPAAVLNSDGSLPQGVDATASGLSLLAKRGPPRGPRGPRKDKLDGMLSPFPQMPPSLPGPMPGLPGMMSPFWPMLHGLPNNLHSPLGMPPRFNPHMPGLPGFGMKSEEMTSPLGGANAFKCNFCSFVAANRDVLTSHVMKVHAGENHDLFSIFGISSESILEDKNRFNALNAMKSPVKSSRVNMFSTEFPPHIKKESVDDMHIGSKVGPGLDLTRDKPVFPYMDGKFPGEGSHKDVGVDILKQMTLKFGSGPLERENKRRHTTDCPLDLTKPRYSPPFAYSLPTSSGLDRKPEEDDQSSGENSVNSGDVTSPPPRKRSRKGKAYKLDTLCMKLQEQKSQAYGSDDDSNLENEEMYTSDLLPVEADGHSPCIDVDRDSEEEERKQQIPMDMKKREYDDRAGEVEVQESQHSKTEMADEALKEIHSSLAILNNKTKHVHDERKENTETDKDLEVEREEPTSSLSEDGNKQVKETSQSPSHNRRKSVPLAIQKGADIAWKILNNSDLTDPAQVIKNGSNGHGMDLSPLDRSNGHGMDLSPLDSKLWISASDCINDLTKGEYVCPHCQIAFGDCIMYTMHMGYHGYKDPYKCNMCGDTCKDRVEFFLHIARAAHN